MKKAVWGVVLACSLVVSGISAVVIVDPVGTSALVGMAPEADPPARVAAARPAPKDAPNAAAASSTAAGEPVMVANADAKAPPPRKTSGGPPPAKTDKAPPPRKDGAAAAPATDNAPVIARKARYVGPVETLPPGRPPRVEFYPLTVSRRTFPDTQSITVELAIKNASGQHWKTAYVALRSARMETAEIFEIQDWALDELIGIDYTFPRAELNDRLQNLRLVSVSGERRESALASLLARSRSQYLTKLFGEEPAEMIGPRTGDRLVAPGLLAYIAMLNAPFTGVGVDAVKAEVATRRPIRVAITDDMRLPTKLMLENTGTSEDLRRVRDQATDFHNKGTDVQKAIDAYVAALGTGLYTDIQDTPAVAGALVELRQKLQAFNASGVMLSQSVQKSRDAGVKRLNLMPMVIDYSRRVRSQTDAIEAAVRAVQPEYKVQQ